MAVLHGGQLARVAKQYQIPEQQWCDLSTGIAPFSYPIPDIPLKFWQALPTISESLINAAKVYYQALHCWPLAGSQQLIEKLPQLWNDKVSSYPNEQKCHQNSKQDKHVHLPKAGYKEHQHAWDKAGYKLHFYQTDLPTEIETGSVVVVINPNNPRTDIFTIQQLKKLQLLCKNQQALLIIDEAFADVFTPEFSFVPHINSDIGNVIVLRSFGKFFGLAGLRIGFACSSKTWCEQIKESIGPWSINGPALYITEMALRDTDWQVKQRITLQKQREKMITLLQKNLSIKRLESNALFITVFLDNAPAVYEQLCQQAIYVRLTDENDALRFGIASDIQLSQLKAKLSDNQLSDNQLSVNQFTNT